MNKFINLLTEAGIINNKTQEIQKHEVELIFIQNSFNKGKNDQGKLNFSQFFKSIENIAKKFFPELEGPNAVKSLLKQNLMKLKKNTYENDIRAVHLMLQEPNMFEVLNFLKETLIPYSKFYLNKQGLMAFDGFMKFCKDFSIFPDFLPKIKLKSIFYCLAATYAKNAMMLTGTRSLAKLLNSNEEYVESEFINFDLFVDCIAISALETVSINRSPEEKIVAGIEKITQSNGSANISLKSGYTRSGRLKKTDFFVYSKPATEEPKPTFLQNLYNKPLPR